MRYYWARYLQLKNLSCGKTESRVKEYRLYFLFGAVYKSKKSRTTNWRYRHGGKSRKQYVKSIQPPKNKVKRVAELKEQGKKIPQIADIMRLSIKTVSNYWKIYKNSLE